LQEQFFNGGGGGRTPGFAEGPPVVFPGDQAPVPGQQSIRRHQAGESIQRFTPQPLVLDSQALALAIIEPQFLAQRFFAHMDFFLQIFDRVLLVAIHPAGNAGQQKC
jgi:hypothetical protein